MTRDQEIVRKIRSWKALWNQQGQDIDQLLASVALAYQSQKDRADNLAKKLAKLEGTKDEQQ